MSIVGLSRFIADCKRKHFKSPLVRLVGKARPGTYLLIQRNGAGFAVETLLGVGTGRKMRLQNLDGDRSVEACILGKVHLGPCRLRRVDSEFRSDQGLVPEIKAISGRN